MITKDQLFVQGELVASIEEIRDVDGRRSSSRCARCSSGRCSSTTAPASRDAELASREITVLADKSLPYEVVKKVMSTCTAAAYGKISLAVIEKEKPTRRIGRNTV